MCTELLHAELDDGLLTLIRRNQDTNKVEGYNICVGCIAEEFEDGDWDEICDYEDNPMIQLNELVMRLDTMYHDDEISGSEILDDLLSFLQRNLTDEDREEIAANNYNRYIETRSDH